MENLIVYSVQAGIVGLVLLGWQMAAPLGLMSPDMLPPFSTVAALLWRELHDSAFQYDVVLTMSEVVIAFLLMTPTGLLIGFFIGERHRLNAIAQPPLQILMAIPKAMFLPLFIIAFGIGFAEKIFFAGMLGVFVIILNGIAAVHSIPQGMIVAVRSMGASRAQLYWRVYLPGMVPLILTSIRIGLIFTIFGVLLAEMYASTRGLGRLIFEAGEAFRLNEMLAGVLLVVTVSIVLNELLRLCETTARRRRGLP